MEENRVQRDGKPEKETYRDKVDRLIQQVHFHLGKKYDGKMTVFDSLENIIKDDISINKFFVCSKANIEKKILAVHNVKNNDILSLSIGPYRQYWNTSLEKFCHRISTMIYTTGMKEEIIEIVFAIILKEMKIRFGRSNEYVFTGSEGIRDEGVIKIK